MPEERNFADCEQFIAETRACGITTVVIAWQEEYAQDLSVPGVVYERVARLLLIAYHKATSTILRHGLNGGRAERAALATRLRDAGFTVEERERNEVRYRT